MEQAVARPAIPRGLEVAGVVAIGRHIGADQAPDIAAALAAGGVRAFELTLNEPEADALAAIEAAARAASAHDIDVGAGTVLSIAAALRALDAGATFLVMPHLDPELVAWAAARGVPALPGAATPTEVLNAWRAGAAAVKVFPASVLGPSFVREMRGPLPDIPLLPTGGVSADTAGEFIAAGAIGVGMGGWLVGNGNPDGVEERARRIVNVVANARAARNPTENRP